MIVVSIKMQLGTRFALCGSLVLAQSRHAERQRKCPLPGHGGPRKPSPGRFV